MLASPYLGLLFTRIILATPPSQPLPRNPSLPHQPTSQPSYASSRHTVRQVRQVRAVHRGRWSSELLAITCSQKHSSSVNHCSKSIFNNVIVTLTIYSFCRLSVCFWSVDITFWMMVAILVEFNVSCNVGAGQHNGRVPLYVYCITLQAALRIAIRANGRLYGRRVVCHMVVF